MAACSCFPQTRAGVSFLYDSEFDLTPTLKKKMEEQLLKFAVNALFNRFDLLVRSHRRASVAIYCGVSGTGVTAWICLGSHGGGGIQEKTLSSLAPVGIVPALHFTLFVRLTLEGGEQSEAHDKMKWPLFLCGWLGLRNTGVFRHPYFNRVALLVNIK